MFVGVKLDDPVGEHDGMFDGKRYFRCPCNHGVMVSKKRVSLLVVDKKKKKSNGRKHDSLPMLSQVPTLPPVNKKRSLNAVTAAKKDFIIPQPPKTPKPASTRSTSRYTSPKPSLASISPSKLSCPPQELVCSECCEARSSALSAKISNRTFSKSTAAIPEKLPQSQKRQLSRSSSRRTDVSSSKVRGN